MKSQSSVILAMLQRRERVSALTVFRRCGCMRLAARIYDLTRAGHRIGCVMVTHRGKRFGVYFLR